MTEEELLKFINITGDLVIIDKEFFEKVLNPCMKIAVDKHKQLIGFLKEKIDSQKQLLKDWKMDTYNYNYQNGMLFAYKDTLDFVKGDKDE